MLLAGRAQVGHLMQQQQQREAYVQQHMSDEVQAS
jgi:hypothetical protein